MPRAGLCRARGYSAGEGRARDYDARAEVRAGLYSARKANVILGCSMPHFWVSQKLCIKAHSGVTE